MLLYWPYVAFLILLAVDCFMAGLAFQDKLSFETLAKMTIAIIVFGGGMQPCEYRSNCGFFDLC